MLCRSNENRLIPVEKRFCVELVEGSSSSSSHYRDTEIFGPGFLSTIPTSTRLQAGTTYCIHSIAGRGGGDPDLKVLYYKDPD